MSSNDEGAAAGPDPGVLTITAGQVTDAELAALVVVLRSATARGTQAGTPALPDRSAWEQPQLRQAPDAALPLSGPARPSWRTSLRPH